MTNNLEDTNITYVKEVKNGFEVWINNELMKRFETLSEAMKFVFIKTDYHQLEMQKEIEMFNQHQLKWQKKWSISLGMLMRKKK